MHCLKKIVLAAITLFLAACAQMPGLGDQTSAPSSQEAQSRYQQGLSHYRENRFDAALAELDAAVSSGQLSQTDLLNARKHLAFIHCVSGREISCREQFQAILRADPKFDLAPNEAGHPTWGPVWRSVKGAMDEQRAIRQAGSLLASPSQQKLAEGIKEYDAGHYKEALDALQAALKTGLPEKADQVRAHKYAAFVYCLTRRTTNCRNEFQKIFAIDSSFELLPSEAGHPAWSTIYRKAKANAAKPTKAMPQASKGKQAKQ